MKKSFFMALVFILLISALVVRSESYNLANMSRLELQELNEQIEDEIKNSHTSSYGQNDSVFNATKDYVENYYLQKGIEVSWPWFHYDYTRDWDFYTLNTDISYQDGNEKRNPDVYAEVYERSGTFELMYLEIGNDMLLDRRSDIPDLRITGDSKASNMTELSDLSVSDLNELKNKIENEISDSHSSNYEQNDSVFNATKEYVENHYKQKGIEVSWPWFHYDYTRDWNLFTLNTDVSYQDGNEKRNPDVYAEVYNKENSYELVFLQIGNDIFLDKRSEIQDARINKNFNGKLTPENTIKPLAKIEATAIPMVEVETAKNEATIAPTATVEPAKLPVETLEPEFMVKITYDGPVNVRESSDAKSEKVGIAKPGDSYVYLETADNGWYKIRLEDGTLGWVSGKMAEFMELSTESSVKKSVSSIVPTQAAESQEYAMRAAIVAMTNGQATDVFMRDGNTYDTSKFHKYSEIHDGYLSVHSEGVWSQKDDTTWRVESMILKLENYEMYIKVSMDVNFDGKSYIISNVELIRAMLEYLDSDDPSKTSGIETMEPSKNTPFLIVSPKLVKDDRKASNEEALKAGIAKKKDDEENRKDWIGGQFSVWNGTHKELEKLIKKNLNDEKSYKHINTEYFDISNEDLKDYFNKVLKDSGYKQRLKLGDLMIVTEFSAKNVFSATIKNTAYGIARYEDNTITLIGIE